MVISFSGLATGMDTGTMIDQLVKLERRPIERIEEEQAVLKSRSSKFGTLRTKLGDLRTAAKALDARSDVLPTKATSAKESVFTARASGGATMGRFGVVVEKVAKSARHYSDPLASRNTAGLVGAGTLSIQVGTGTAVDITVDASDTLDSVAAKINSSGAAVRAGILYDGTSYRLQLTGNETGAANALTITESGLTLNLDEAANRVQAAQDSRIVVDGFPITRATNTVADAIPGVTLELKEEALGEAINVDVTRDPASLKESAQKLVDAFNAINSFMNAESSAPAAGAKGRESLIGDSTLRTVQARLRSIAGSPVEGLAGRYTTLGSIGISVQRDGSLALDGAKLEDALEADAEAVANVLAKENAGVSVKLAAAVDEWTRAGDGLITSRIGSLDQRQRAMNDQIAKLELRIEKYEENLRRQFSTLEQTVSGLQNQGQRMMSVLQSLA